MADVRYDQATRIYPGSDTAAVDRLDLDIADGEFLVLVGPSGSGKSTALRMLAGLEPIDGGSVHIGGRDVTLVRPRDRDIAMVFQNYALYPQMSVGSNMGFALKQQGVPKDERQKRVRDAARILGLEEFLDRKPKNLSGGQRQRVAMGRAIVREPQVFLMDEPLSNLDAKLRVQTRAELSALQARLAVTTVYVTHDQVEAMTMGDRVAVLNYGVLQQCASPRELYRQPANLFVAGFIGSPAMNLLETTVEGGAVLLGDHRLNLDPAVAATLRNGERADVTVGMRPEHLTLGTDGISGQVSVVEELGSETYVHITVEHRGNQERVVARIDGDAEIHRGDNVKIAPAGPVHVFSADGARIPAASEAVAV
ncbi:MAG: sn-glycerol-3-phosphate ABC transporter ATP-binding protein UgpC [Actinomycetota bacterium]|nr:sn-glycerol-3-phosphate ABC transporter ATP-binding protein UgpC [Actinomycetota bacterium]